MRKMEICRKTADFENGGQRTIVYSVTIDDLSETSSGTQLENYGLCVSIFDSGEEAFVRRITFNKFKIFSLLDLISSNAVTPVTVLDVVNDWIAV